MLQGNFNLATSTPAYTSKDCQMLRAFTNKLGLRFDDKLLEFLEVGDIIEVYDKNSIQVFRNHMFHDVYSHSLIDLFTKPRSELFNRNDFFEKQISEIEAEVFQSKTSNIFTLKHIKPHLIEEINSLELKCINISLQFMYPLLNKFSITEYTVLVSRVN